VFTASHSLSQHDETHSSAIFEREVEFAGLAGGELSVNVALLARGAMAAPHRVLMTVSALTASENIGIQYR
jgi:hypothetical protein